MNPLAEQLKADIEPFINAALHIEACVGVPLAAYQLPIRANYACDFVSRVLCDYLYQVRPDLTVELVQVCGIDPELNTARVHPKGRGLHFEHTVVWINRTLFIDLTYRQWAVESPFPFYGDTDELKALWAEIKPIPEDFVFWPIPLLDTEVVNVLLTKEVSCGKVLTEGLIHGGYEKWHTVPLSPEHKPVLVTEVAYPVLWKITTRMGLNTRRYLNEVKLSTEDVKKYSAQMVPAMKEGESN